MRVGAGASEDKQGVEVEWVGGVMEVVGWEACRRVEDMVQEGMWRE